MHTNLQMHRTMTAALALSVLASLAHAHGLRYTMSRADAVVVTITHEDGSPFSDQHYQVHRGDDDVAFQTGRTDSLGRITIVSDVSGPWRVRAFSPDGHGIDVRLASGGPGVGSDQTPPDTAANGRWSRIVLALAMLFGVFGVVSMLYRRRSPHT